MENTKSKKTILIILVSVLLISLLGIGGYFLFKKRLKYDSELGMLAKEKVTNAQYLPNVDGLFLNSNQVQVATLSNPTVSDLSQDDFQQIVDNLGHFDNFAGAGKYLGYDIYEIKNEIEFVVEKVPAFNQWFRMPQMRIEEGYLDIPYYENWAYYLDYNEETKALTITRVCWSTRTDFIDFNSKSSREGVQYEIMQTKYYYEEEKEVVEVKVYCVGIEENYDSFNSRYNSNEEEYYPYEYIYLKNVKDTSLTKYHIVSAERYRDDETFDEGGMDIRGEAPYGTIRNFLNLSYTDSDNINMLRISQVLPTDVYRLAKTTNIMMYSEIEGNVDYFAEAYDYYDENSSVNHQLLAPFLTYNTSEFDIVELFSFSHDLSSYSRNANVDANGVIYSNTISRTKKQSSLYSSQSEFLNIFTDSIMNLGKLTGATKQANDEFKSSVEDITSLDNDTVYETNLDKYIDSLSKSIVDNFELRANWKNIYKEQSKAIKCETIKGDFYGKADEIFVEDLSSLLDFYYNNTGSYNLNINADIIEGKEHLIDSNKEYSLSTILKSETGDIYIVDTYYGGIEEVYYNGSTEETYLRFNQGPGWVDNGGLYHLNIDKAGTYTLMLAIITKDELGNEEIMLDTNMPVFIHRYKKINVPNSINSNGTISSYDLIGTGGKLVVEVEVN